MAKKLMRIKVVCSAGLVRHEDELEFDATGMTAQDIEQECEEQWKTWAWDILDIDGHWSKV